MPEIKFNNNGFRAIEVYDPLGHYWGTEYQYLIKDLSIETNTKLKIKTVTVEYEVVNQK